MKSNLEAVRNEPIRWDRLDGEKDICPECGHIGLTTPARRRRVCTACGNQYELRVPPNRWSRSRSKTDGSYDGPAVRVTKSRGETSLVGLFNLGIELSRRHARRGEYEVLVMQLLEALEKVES